MSFQICTDDGTAVCPQGRPVRLPVTSDSPVLPKESPIVTSAVLRPDIEAQHHATGFLYIELKKPSLCFDHIYTGVQCLLAVTLDGVLDKATDAPLCVHVGSGSAGHVYSTSKCVFKIVAPPPDQRREARHALDGAVAETGRARDVEELCERRVPDQAGAL